MECINVSLRRSANAIGAAAGGRRGEPRLQPGNRSVVLHCKESRALTPSMWSHAKPHRAEAVCETFSCCGHIQPEVVCRTRVLVPPQMRASAAALARRRSERLRARSSEMEAALSADALPEAPRPNLLLLLIDPISRAQFSRSLPQVRALLPTLTYDTFTRYAAVGNNSGPNQAALYRGSPLRSRHDLHNSTWLWDELGRKGYATLKGEVRHACSTLCIRAI